MQKAIKTGYFYVLVDFVVISGVLEVHFFGRKTSQKKRKTFDMTKARVKGTEAAAFVKSQAQLKVQESKVYMYTHANLLRQMTLIVSHWSFMKQEKRWRWA